MTTTANQKATIKIANGDRCEGTLYFIGDSVVFTPLRAIELLVAKGMEKATANKYVITLKAAYNRCNSFVEQEVF